MKPRNPKTQAEWQEAVDAAQGALALEAARQYGLVMGGPRIDAGRCEHLLILGKRRGVTPRDGCEEQFIERMFWSLATARSSGVRGVDADGSRIRPILPSGPRRGPIPVNRAIGILPQSAGPSRASGGRPAGDDAEAEIR